MPDQIETVTTVAPILRKYFYEIVVLALASCTVSLFMMYNSLSTFIRSEMAKQMQDQSRVIERNTDAFNLYLTRTGLLPMQPFQQQVQPTNTAPYYSNPPAPVVTDRATDTIKQR